MTENDTPLDPTAEYMARARARSEAKNKLARDALDPLEQGERPLAVTVSSVVAMTLSIGNLVAYVLRSAPAGDAGKNELPQIILICGVLAATSIGMWFKRYWAVLGFQTILGIQIIVITLAATRVNSIWVALLFIGIIAFSGVLFWFLIKAMARIQMPEGPETKALREYIDAEEAKDAAAGFVLPDDFDPDEPPAPVEANEPEEQPHA